MKTIQVVMDEELLRETDREAKKMKLNRSAMIREALREHLQRKRIAAMEERHRRGYEKFPVQPGEFPDWDAVRTWPED